MFKNSIGGKIPIVIHKKNEDFPGPSYVPPQFGVESKKICVSPKYPERRTEQGPGPADYSPLTIISSPRISIKEKNCIEKGENSSPGPGAYIPDFSKVMPTSPRPYIHVKPEIKQKDVQHPGPGQYTIPRNLNPRPVSFHIRTRYKENEASPGPSDYTPDYSKTQPSSPRPYVHVKPTAKIRDEGDPGPGQYDVSRKLEARPITFHIRTRMKTNDATPGPADYAPNGRLKSPSYTIGPRIEQKNKKLDVPYYSIPSSVGEGPKITINSRTKEKPYDPQPGPAYTPPQFGSESTKVTFGHRYYKKTEDTSPGPGQYPTPDSRTCKISIHPKLMVKTENNGSPGPAAYSPDYTVTKKSSPRPYIHVKPTLKSTDKTPGYVSLPTTLKGPAFTIGHKDSHDIAVV